MQYESSDKLKFIKDLDWNSAIDKKVLVIDFF